MQELPDREIFENLSELTIILPCPSVVVLEAALGPSCLLIRGFSKRLLLRRRYSGGL